MRSFERRLAKAEERATGGVHRIELFFMPTAHPDPAAFQRECESKAGGAQTIVIRFVRPEQVQ